MGDNNIDNLSIQISGSANEAVAAINNVASSFNKVKGAAKDAASNGLKPVKDEMEDVAGNSEKTTHTVRTAARGITNFWNVLRRGASTGLRTLGQLPIMFGRNIVNSVQSAANSVMNFGSQIKRMAIRMAIRAAIKEIVKGIQEGIKNLYEWSKLVDTHFSKTMDGLASSSLYLKNSLGAMAAPLITAIAPAVEYVIDKLVDMFNVVNQVFARLTGQSTYTVAKKVATVWDDSSDKSKKTAQNTKKINDELKKTILSFDEINKLEKQTEPKSSTSGGSTSGKTTPDYASMFETRKIDSKIKTFADQIRAAINKGDWKSLGTLLGNKVNQIVNSIDFAGLGKKVGYGINAWFSTKYWTLSAINFTNIGSKIAIFLNNAIKQIDFEVLGRLMVKEMTIIGDLVIGFFSDFDFRQAGGAISKFVTGIFDEISDWLKDTDWEKLGDDIVNGIIDFFDGMEFGDIVRSFSRFMGSALGAGAKLIKGIGTAIYLRVVESLGSVKKYFDKRIEDCGGNIVLGILSGIILGLTNIVVWIVNNVFTPFINGFKEAFGIASPAKKMRSVGINIILGIFNGIKSALAGIGEWVKNNIFNPFMKAVKNAGEWVVKFALHPIQTAKEVAGAIKTLWDEAIETVGTLSVNFGFNSKLGETNDPYYGSGSQYTQEWYDKNIKPLESASKKPVKVTVAAVPGAGVTKTAGGSLKLKKIPDENVDALVKLVKSGWSTIVDWCYYSRGGNIKESVELVKKGWSTIDKWAKLYKGDKLNQAIGLVKTGWSYVDSWVKRYSGGTISQGISLFVDNWYGFLGGISNALHSWFPTLFAEGGVIQNGHISRFANGGYINAYAGGTSSAHGSLFLAGERGPEIVGHVGGRTEVLNKSQLAATMYEAVRAAMSGITIDADFAAGMSAGGTDDSYMLAEYVRAGVEGATARQNELLREQNRLLQELLNKPMTAELTTNSVVNALQRKNRRDGTTVVPVYG